jgi:hypothetical protein
MQLTPEARPPIGVVFDSDFGNSVDSALGLGLLYGFDARKEARVVAVSVSNQNLKAAELADVISHFYLRPSPIGLYADGKWTGDTPIETAPLAMRKEDGASAFVSTIKKLNDTADPAPLIRNALTAQHDQNCVIILAGPAVDLAAMLALHGAKNIVVSKVRCLVTTEVAFALPASKRFFNEWPTPIVIASDARAAIVYPASSVESDFSWSPAHPIVAAYRAYRPMPYDATVCSMAAVLYAVHPDSPYFKPPESVPGFDGRVRKFILDPAQKDAILKVYTEIASARPVPRARPGPPKVEEAKPEKAAGKNQ